MCTFLVRKIMLVNTLPLSVFFTSFYKMILILLGSLDDNRYDNMMTDDIPKLSKR